MRKENQEKFESAVKFLEETYKRKLTEEEINDVKKKYDNPIAREVALRPGEVDLGDLSQKQYNQLLDRHLFDIEQRLNILTQVMNDLYYAKMLELKSKYEDPFEELEKFKTEQYEKMLKENKLWQKK